MATEQVFDPRLGEDRDAFPGEVVAPGKEKTLQRLMREEEERFTSDLTEVKATGKLTPSDEDAVRRFAKLRAEVQRAKYLEALNSNPANIIQNTLKEFNPAGDDFILQALVNLDNSVIKLQNNSKVEKASDRMRTAKQSTVQNIESYLKRDSNGKLLIRLTFDRNRSIDTANRNTNTTFELLKKLGLLPEESLSSFSDVRQAVISTGNNDPLNGKPYSNSRDVFGLSSSKPGLEGISANIDFSTSDSVNFVKVFGSPEALARIVDKGQYVPFKQ